MTVDDDAASIKSTTSFYSALSETGNTEPPLLEEVDGVMKEFCLDIDKLEKVASARNGGLACAVRRPEGFAKGTYFLLCAEFEDNTSWDIIIPHPDVIPQRKARNLSTDSSPRTSLERRKSAPRTPKLLSWSASPANDAGVVYFFVNSLEHWESSDWSSFAAEQNDDVEGTELRRVLSPASTILTNSSQSSVPTRTTSQTSCTEAPKPSVKLSKTVRFEEGHALAKSHSPIPSHATPVGEEMNAVEEKPTRKKRLRRLRRCLRRTKWRIERPFITLLMKLGY